MDFSNITAPSDYRETAILAQEAAQGLMERLQIMTLQPQQILDVGCGLGCTLSDLALRYPQAQIIGLDLAQSFLQDAKQKSDQLDRKWIVADTHSLPLRAHSVDLIFANVLLPWVMNPAQVFREWRRVLKPNGLLLFSSLGPGTFKECRAEFTTRLVDMHDTGDALLNEGFLDPVLEVEELVLHYRSQDQLRIELEKSGMLLKEQPLAEMKNQDGVYPLTYEIVYGHAFCPPVKTFKADAQGVVSIPISQLKR